MFGVLPSHYRSRQITLSKFTFPPLMLAQHRQFRPPRVDQVFIHLVVASCLGFSVISQVKIAILFHPGWDWGPFSLLGCHTHLGYVYGCDLYVSATYMWRYTVVVFYQSMFYLCVTVELMLTICMYWKPRCLGWPFPQSGDYAKMIVCIEFNSPSATIWAILCHLTCHPVHCCLQKGLTLIFSF